MTELFALIAAALKLPPTAIEPGTSMKNTPAWDSLAHMELIIGIEDRYRVVLDADEIADMTSVASIIGQLAKRGLVDDAA
ncbi:acyl carrier protein [Accumulibacter sp.]|jgi:acyl carrier protein|uniref:acyl carrier protein n=1 Tax=Accumulibacter sp. TaxID=2053492 RepID=UPI001ACD046F|nr:acyl carrier protein [Accumulibacter sp.]MBN8454898.1 acyl carrier protein [Accumulibacter sp.]MBO3706869.1 acyl carrier protein [Candidatus Accumulibacter conexus]